MAAVDVESSESEAVGPPPARAPIGRFVAPIAKPIRIAVVSIGADNRSGHHVSKEVGLQSNVNKT